ncbi:rhodanese-like domain-containing protein [Paucihalobacter ruber]|uniref:Rhodanese-like domain-containing protein n=1 Tax=Paucihalobacter ruber TaxID=2567861 RepID=A0A506PHP2_9FLAO|nr:rhodanese-like domain-containing protein [Paucihalobacter ruber]TPV31890.1 rhodanese-like domain-containing protein [Paucihalobacter ruber]
MKHLNLHIILILCSLGFNTSLAQTSIDAILKQYNKGNIPYISVQELNENFEEAIILDAREMNEFKVSHIKNALYVGHKYFNSTKILEQVPDLSQPIVVYCSIGVRSETIGNALKKAGYTNVKNLYGGIFEWKNQGFPVVDSIGNETDKVHAFSKQWGKWLKKGTKIYE